MVSDKKENESPSLTALLLNDSEYDEVIDDDDYSEETEIDSTPVRFEESTYETSFFKPNRWKLGSQIGSTSKGTHQDYRKLKHIHQSIASKENELDSKTLKRNLHFASLLVQWFPEQMIDNAVAELHKTDMTKVIADQAVVVRILGYIEALLRVSCRTIPWSTVFEINDELGMNIDKNDIAAAKFTAVSKDAYKEFYKKRGGRETFDVIRFQITRLIANLEGMSDPRTQKKEILDYSRKLCSFLEKKQIIPKDPEIYGHAIVELACKKVLKTRNLQTLSDPRLKKKLSTAIHYIKKQIQKK